MTLPSTQISIETLQAKAEAVDMVDGLIKRNFELEEIFQCLQPLLYELSVTVYGDDDKDVSLAKLMEDSVTWIKSKK